jgi:hypothetical protein
MWDLSDIGPLSPGDIIGIEYDAIALEPGLNLNKGTANAHCSVDYSVVVIDADIAGAMVVGEGALPPSPEEVLEIALELHAESESDGMTCWSTVTVNISAQDLSGGSYPVKSVSITLHGAPFFNSGPVSTPYYSKTLVFEAGCGESFIFEATAVNSLGMHATTGGGIVTPVP